MSEMKVKRTFSKEEKLVIWKEASAHGVKPSLAKHGLYAATYYSWRNKFKAMGKIGLELNQVGKIDMNRKQGF